MSLLADFGSTLPRFTFFTGKGGVGKTSTACVVAVQLADAGHRVLLVSTDPASNLGQVLDHPVGTTAGPTGIDRLDALNVDPDAAAAAYREQVIGPIRSVLPDDAVQQITEQLSGACTVEVAAFDEFANLLIDAERIAGYDHVLFDTAPTGHTLRLLQLPAAWSDYLDDNARGASCLGPLGGQVAKRDRYAAATAVLRDAAQTLVVLVARADVAALDEAERTRVELGALGLTSVRLVVNGVFTAARGDDPIAAALEARSRAALDAMPAGLIALPRTELPLRPFNLVGPVALRAHLTGSVPPVAWAPASVEEYPGLDALVADLADRETGLVMVMGKGGVGKTTVAAALAVALAVRGRSVHLTTTDPAAHLSRTLAATVAGLRVTRIDPAVESAAYRDKILARSARTLDADGLALLAEDLLSPCTEEVAVFHAFSKVVNAARHEVVIVDTAPTGHTLLLLDAAGSYHREILRDAGGAAGQLITPLMRLQDPAYTRLLLVTLPEATPVAEAAALQEDLARAGIRPWAWVVNQSLTATHTSDPLLLARAAAERPYLERVRHELSDRIAVVPMQVADPVGPEALLALLGPVAAPAG